MRSCKYTDMPIFILTCGLTGTGKSTIASEIHKITGISIIRSDVIRKQLAQIEEDDHRLNNFGEGIYSEVFFNLTYTTMFNMASEILQKGKSVLIDASFKKRKYREQAKKLALKYRVPFLIIECKCSGETVKNRLLKRSAKGGDPSDGRWEIYEKQKADFENITDQSNNLVSKQQNYRDNISESDIGPPPEAFSGKEHLVLNTEIEILINLDKVIHAIKEMQSE